MSDKTLQMPDGVEIVETSETYGRFVVKPLERGFGTTLGNSLRRVLLSSLPGHAVTAIKVDGVQHELSTVPGVSEDVADIILNLKEVRFRAENGTAGETVQLQLDGPDDWKAEDIGESTSDFTILNPDRHIATLSEEAHVNVELRIGEGQGYVPAAQNKREDDPIGVIPTDAIFSPIQNVKYDVTPTRVGQQIRYEELELEVTTDGSITPEEAVTEAAKILQNHVDLFVKVEAEPEEEEAEEEVDEEVKRVRALLQQSVDELDLSVRAQNCLKAAKIEKIGDLVRKEENEMLKFRNFGRKSLQELIEVLEERDLHFGMDVDKYLEEAEQSS